MPVIEAPTTPRSELSVDVLLDLSTSTDDLVARLIQEFPELAVLEQTPSTAAQERMAAPLGASALSASPSAPGATTRPKHPESSRPGAGPHAAGRRTAAETKEPGLLGRMARRVGRWAGKAAVATTAVVSVAYPFLHPGGQPAENHAPGGQPKAPAAAPAPAAFNPKIEITAGKTPNLSVIDLLPEAIPNDPNAHVVTAVLPQAPPPGKHVIVKKGDTLNGLVNQTLKERGLDPHAPSAANPQETNLQHISNRILQENKFITNPGRIMPSWNIYIPDDSPVATTEQTLSVEGAANPYQNDAMKAAAELTPLIQKDPAGNIQIMTDAHGHGWDPTFSWQASSSMLGLQRYNQAFPGTSYGISTSDIAKLASRYWDGNPASMGYAVSFASVGQTGTERYIDDGGWQGEARIMLLAAQIKHGETPDLSAITEAQSMVNIAMENFDPNVGLEHWVKQPDPNNRKGFNTISTGLSAELALLVNQFTPKDSPQYQTNLAFAMQAYEGARSNMLDPTDHLYYDGIDDHQVLDKRKFTYNAGVMIGVGMWLYEATGEQKYLDAAEQTAKGGLALWTKDTLRLEPSVLVGVYLDRLYNLRQVTKDENLRAAIADTITNYADWYTKLTKISDAHLPGSNWPGPQELARDTFPGTKLHVASLAALIYNEKNNNKGPILQAGQYNIPNNVVVEAQGATPPKPKRDRTIA